MRRWTRAKINPDSRFGNRISTRHHCLNTLCRGWSLTATLRATRGCVNLLVIFVNSTKKEGKESYPLRRGGSTSSCENYQTLSTGVETPWLSSRQTETVAVQFARSVPLRRAETETLMFRNPPFGEPAIKSSTVCCANLPIRSSNVAITNTSREGIFALVQYDTGETRATDNPPPLARGQDGRPL